MASHDVKNIKDAAILLANDLRSGLTVYYTAKSTWSENSADAWLILNDADAEKALAQAAQTEDSNEVVGAYLVDATSDGLPTHVRERLRVEGPSINYLKG